jgi:hypothetical protein
MTVESIVTLLGAVGAFITAIVSAYLSLRNARKIDVTNAKQDATHEVLKAVVDTVAAVQTNVKTVEVATNHMKDALVAATASSSLQQGRTEGIAIEKERASSEAPK